MAPAVRTPSPARAPAAAVALRAIGALLLGAVAAPAAALDPSKAIHHYVTDSWGLDDGLPQIQVTAITQGPDDYLWVGTRSGLARFDGVKFRTYVTANTPELHGMVIRALHADRHERLWIGSYKGVTVYENGRFTALAPPSAGGADSAGQAPPLDVRGFAELPDGTVLVATDRGLLGATGEGLGHWAEASGEHAVLVRGDEVWSGGVGRVVVIADGSTSARPLPAGFEQALVRHLVVHDGRVVAGTSRGLLQFDEATGWQPLPLRTGLEGEQVNALFVDRDEVLWVATASGISRLWRGRELPQPSHAPVPTGVNAIAEDHEGNLWLGSDAGGVSRLRNGLTQRYSTPEGLHEPGIWSLAPDPRVDGAIWVGTLRGLSRFVDGRFELIVPASELPDPGVYTLLAEPERVWLGTRSGGLALFEAGELSIPPGTEALAGANVSAILGAGGGAIWLATSEGLCRYQRPRLTCHGREAGLRDQRLRFVHETRDGRLLAGSRAGLFAFEDDRFVPVGEGVIAPDDDITALNELADGTLVVGTLSEKLYLGTASGWRAFDAGDGLPINSPFFSALDERGELWVAGLRGLYRVPYREFEEYRRGEIDRLDGRMLLNERGDVRGAQRAYCCNGAGRAKGFLRDGLLWLPTRDGIIAIDTRRVRTNPHPPNVVVEQYRLDAEWIDHRPGSGIRVPPGQRNLAVRFTALSFEAPESVRFRYRLRGFDRGWKTPDDSAPRSAFYTNLPPGEHVFEVLAANNDGLWQQRPAAATVVVEPLLHETRAFALCVVIAAALLVFAGCRFVIGRQRRQQQRLQALIDARTDELRVANEHLRAYSERLQEMSRTDPLTGLWNRRYLHEQLPADLAQHARRTLAHGDGAAPATLFAIVDLDHFKALNDRHGHSAGDQVLREFAGLVSSLLRTGDYLVRWGGEEFVIVMRDVSPAQAELALERILNAVAVHPFGVLGGSPRLRVTCSIGYACYPFAREAPEAFTWEQTLEIADRALYAAKQAGRARCHGLHAGSRRAASLALDAIRYELQALLDAGVLRESVVVAERRTTPG